MVHLRDGLSRRYIIVLIAGMLLLGVLLAAGPAVAMDCAPGPNGAGVYVCDARQSVPRFDSPDYPRESIFFSTTYAWLEDFAPLYSAPDAGAEVVKSFDVGLLYTTIEGTATDAAGRLWYRVADDHWARAEDVHVVEESKLTGVEINVEPERPFGWVRHVVRPSPEAGVLPPEDTPWISRYTFVEIYDVVEGEDDRIWYNIGDGRWVKEIYVALVDVSPRPEDVGEDEFWVEVDLYEQVMAAYEGDRMVYAGLVATGIPPFDTNEGLFQVWAREEETHMYGGELDDYYYLQDVPHTQFFDEEIALHGAYWHNDFGAVRSHGCVNMPPRDAEWVFNWSENAPNTLWVYVHESEPDHLLARYGEMMAADTGYVTASGAQ
ncbi:MAG: L,D-transpeptidase [Candidatus Promineifilaceae bacterium]|nr:L,D-transpeptidase [Candidatus Promineifilaceae bacterium]